MKTLLAVTVVALAVAVPAALGDTPPPSQIQTTPNGQQSGQSGQSGPQQIVRRIRTIARRFDATCGTSSSSAPQQCVTFAQNAVQRLDALDAKLQAKNTPAATKLDGLVKTLAQKLQAWLGS